MTAAELKAQKAVVEDKLARLKSGALKCEQTPGDGRQESAIHRAESQLQQINRELAASKEGK